VNSLILVDVPEFDGAVSAAWYKFVIIIEGEICYHIVVALLNSDLFIFHWAYFHDIDSLIQRRKGNFHAILREAAVVHWFDQCVLEELVEGKLVTSVLRP
jgi:hypothetical protein